MRNPHELLRSHVHHLVQVLLPVLLQHLFPPLQRASLGEIHSLLPRLLDLRLIHRPFRALTPPFARASLSRQHLLRSYERSHEKFMQLRRWILDVLPNPNVSIGKNSISRCTTSTCARR